MTPTKLQSELKQSKPFPSVHDEACIQIVRTADALSYTMGSFLRTYDLTPTQYNVLRILRGAGDDGHSCGEIASRMVSRVPDMTRLLDRLEQCGWLERKRSEQDRRVVSVRITPAGRKVINKLDKPMTDNARELLGHMSPEKLRSLCNLLESVRENLT